MFARSPVIMGALHEAADGARLWTGRMIFEPMGITDVKRIVPSRFADERGYFSEVFNRSLCEAAGIAFQPVQENQSLSRSVGTVRGLHFQTEPFAQAKLVRVLRGRIFDVAVDIRQGSASYGQWVATELSAAGGEQLFIPTGFAHGFCTLEPDTEIAYLVDAHYSPECDGVILWNDPVLGIDWPSVAGAVLSAKDRAAPRLAEIAPPF